MKNFFLRLKTAWTFFRKFPYVALPDDYWTPADAKAWSNFLSSDTGAKINHLRWNEVYESQQKAVMDRSDPAYSAGIAFGIWGMVHREDALLAISLPEGESRENNAEQDEGQFRSVNH